jgi:hypothetical protein
MRTIAELLAIDERRRGRPIIYPDRARPTPIAARCHGDRVRAAARIGVKPRPSTFKAERAARAAERDRVLKWIEHNEAHWPKVIKTDYLIAILPAGIIDDGSIDRLRVVLACGLRDSGWIKAGSENATGRTVWLRDGDADGFASLTASERRKRIDEAIETARSVLARAARPQMPACAE